MISRLLDQIEIDFHTEKLKYIPSGYPQFDLNQKYAALNPKTPENVRKFTRDKHPELRYQSIDEVIRSEWDKVEPKSGLTTKEIILGNFLITRATQLVANFAGSEIIHNDQDDSFFGIKPISPTEPGLNRFGHMVMTVIRMHQDPAFAALSKEEQTQRLVQEYKILCAQSQDRYQGRVKKIEKEFTHVENLLKASYSKEELQPLQETLSHYKTLIVNHLAEGENTHIIPSLHDGQFLLMGLWVNAVQNKLSQEALLKELNKFRNEYLNWEAIAKLAHEDLVAASANNGIYKGLELNRSVDTVYGTDTDVRLLAQGLMQYDDAPVDKVIMLNPVNLAPRMHAGAQEHAELEKELFYNKIKTVLENPSNTGKTYSILMLVNDSDSHWRLAEVKVANGKIASAELWDSLASLSQENAAYKNMNDSIARLSGPAVTIKAVGIQQNGWQCMDYALAEAFIRIQKANLPLTSNANVFVAAKNSKELRDAGVQIIKSIQARVATNVEPQVPPKPSVPTEQSLAQYDDKKLEDELFDKLSNVAKAQVNPTKDTVTIQTDFDAAMAKKLQASYSQGGELNEPEKVNTARRQTANEMADKLKREGIFAHKEVPQVTQPIEPIGATLSVEDAAILKLVKDYFYHEIKVTKIDNWKLLTGSTNEAKLYQHIQPELQRIAREKEALITSAKASVPSLTVVNIPVVKIALDKALSAEFNKIITSLPPEIKSAFTPKTSSPHL